MGKVIEMVLLVSQDPGREMARPCLPGNTPPGCRGSPPPGPVCSPSGVLCWFQAVGLHRSGFLQPCHVPGREPGRLTKPACGARASCAGSKGGVPGVEQNPATPGDGPVPVRSFLIVRLRAGVGALPGESVTLPSFPSGRGPSHRCWGGPVRGSHATCGFAVPWEGP